jgi:hypothetical protein
MFFIFRFVGGGQQRGSTATRWVQANLSRISYQSKIGIYETVPKRRRKREPRKDSFLCN